MTEKTVIERCCLKPSRTDAYTSCGFQFVPPIPMKMDRKKVISSAGPLVVLGVLSMSVWLTDSNTSVFIWINSRTQALGDLFWESVTVMGDGLVALVIMAPFVLRRPRIVLSGAISGLLVLAGVQGLKAIARGLPRPLNVLSPDSFHHAGPAFGYNTFPSGHAATAFMFAAILCFFYRSWLVRTLILAAAVLVSVSRMAVGVHWPQDVLVGAIVGWVAGIGGSLIADRSKWGDHRVTRIVLEAALLTGALSMFFYNTTQDPAVDGLLRLIAIAAVAILLFSIDHEVTRGEAGLHPASEQ